MYVLERKKTKFRIHTENKQMKKYILSQTLCILFLSQYSIAESPIDTKDSNDSKPIAESQQNSITQTNTHKTTTNTNNTLHENLDYLLQDSHTKFPVSDFIWQKERNNQDINEYFNNLNKETDSTKTKRIIGYDSKGNPIYVDEKGQVVDKNGNVLAKSEAEYTQTLKEKMLQEQKRLQQEQEKLQAQNAKKQKNKIKKQSQIKNTKHTKKETKTTIPQRIQTEEEIEQRFKEEYIKEAMNNEYGDISKESFDSQTSLFLDNLKGQRDRAYQPEEKSKNIYGDSRFSNQENVDAATNEHKLSRTILAGKLIPAILLTPIQSGIEGLVQAQVEQDIYATMGRAVLIPRGSKVLGFYKNDNQIGQDRLAITWREIITPQGVNILLTNAIAGDSEGVSGVKGHLNNKYWQKYGMGIVMQTLANSVTFGIANLTQKENASITSQYSTGQLLSQAQNDINNSLKQMISQQSQVRPIISIKAGSRIFITPTAHIWFPIPKHNETMAKYFDEE